MKKGKLRWFNDEKEGKEDRWKEEHKKKKKQETWWFIYLLFMIWARLFVRMMRKKWVHFFFLFQLQYDSVPEEHWCGSNRPRKEVKNRITRFELKKGPSFEINVPIRKGLIVNHCLYIQPDGTWDCNNLSPRKRKAKYFLTFLSLFNQGGCWTMARKQLFWFWHFFRQWLLY